MKYKNLRILLVMLLTITMSFSGIIDVAFAAKPQSIKITTEDNNFNTDIDTPIYLTVTASTTYDVDAGDITWNVDGVVSNIDSNTFTFTYTPDYTGDIAINVTASLEGVRDASLTIVGTVGDSGTTPVEPEPTDPPTEYADLITIISAPTTFNTTVGETVFLTYTASAKVSTDLKWVVNNAEKLSETGDRKSETIEVAFTPTSIYDNSFEVIIDYTDRNGTAQESREVIGIVLPANNAPIAESQTLTTDEDTAVDVTLKATDEDINDTLTYEVVTGPTNGTLTINQEDGTYTYTPDENFNGNDSFTFKSYDQKDYSEPATITIAITPINDAPVASNGTLEIIENTIATGTLEALDVDGDNLTYEIATAPINGSVSIDSTTGEYTYTPQIDSIGTDSFTFTVSDGNLNSTGTIDITISEVNDAPVITGDSLTTDEDTLITEPFIASDDENDTLTYEVVTGPNNGTVTIDQEDGTYTYAPDENFNGNDSFTFIANDGANNSNTGTINITIDPVNDAPVAEYASLAVKFNTETTGTLVASDVDGDTLTYEIFTQPSFGTVNITNKNTGEYTYTPEIDSTDDDMFIFRVYDGSLYSEVAIISVYILPEAINYVALGDSIATGTVVDGHIDAETSYVTYFREYIETQSGSPVELIDFSTDGYTTDDLLIQLPFIENELRSADIITISIGGNNLMNAAKKSFGEIEYYNFNNIDAEIAKRGMEAFEIEFPEIISTIKSYNPDAEIIVNTIYNPFNKKSDSTNYDLVESYLHKDGVGINDVIRINNVIESKTNYNIAEVYDAFESENSDTKEEITYMYIDDIIYALFELRNPHPNSLGQNIIANLHKTIYDTFNN